MSNLLKIILCLVLILSGCAAPGLNKESLPPRSAAEHPSVELQLLGVHLGMPYTEAKAELTQKYGPPFKSESTPRVADTFKLAPNTDNVLKIFADEKRGYPSTVMMILVDGTTPIPGLNFFSNANLGDSEADIRLKFPKAELKQGKGYHHYMIPFTNYFLGVENGKVTSLGITVSNTFPVKGGGDSIALSYNFTVIAYKKGWLSEKGLLSNPLDMPKLKALVEDPLRPYCKERYPLRQALNGRVYIDVNVFKNEKESPIPATFLLDTGQSITAVSPELCKKLDCKNRESPFPRPEGDERKRVDGGFIGFGSGHGSMDVISVIPPKSPEQGQSDGVLGDSTLFANKMFINFKQGYLCFPALPVSEVAQKLRFAEFSPRYMDMGIFTDFYVNNKWLARGHLDSGADMTYLSKKDIAYLKLKRLNKTMWYDNYLGAFHAPLYGPVEIGWPSFGFTQGLQEIAERVDDDGNSLIGMDFLRDTILGLDFEATGFFGFYLKR